MSRLEVRFAEEIARVTTRRRFLKRAASATVGGVSLFMVTGPLAGKARSHTLNGQRHCANVSGSSVCNPPFGRYCTGCNGHQCPPGMSWTTYWGYASACWCTPRVGTTRYICCDCSNGDHSQDCGCFSIKRHRAGALDDE
jgi:hypothetical protein